MYYNHEILEILFISSHNKNSKDNTIYLQHRSVWYYPLRLDAPLYIEVVFNQIAPDYLEGLLLVLPGEHLPQEVVVSSIKLM